MMDIIESKIELNKMLLKSARSSLRMKFVMVIAYIALIFLDYHANDTFHFTSGVIFACLIFTLTEALLDRIDYKLLKEEISVYERLQTRNYKDLIVRWAESDKKAAGC